MTEEHQLRDAVGVIHYRSFLGIGHADVANREKNEQGLLRWFVTHKYPIFDPNGRVVGIMGSIQEHGKTDAAIAAGDPAMLAAADYIQKHFRTSISEAFMILSDLSLARRLERTEGAACIEFTAANKRAYPNSQAAWAEIGGAYCAFNGVDSPITQAFGLGLNQPLSVEVLKQVEDFFFSRGAAAAYELCPLAGVEAFQILCDAGYKPIELSTVLCRTTQVTETALSSHIEVRIVDQHEAALWAGISARGWAHDYPQMFDMVRMLSSVTVGRQGGLAFLGLYDGVPGAAGSLFIQDGIALFAGSATIPELRNRGLQSALLGERMRYAHEMGCDLAMMVAAPGSNSQRNAQRQGFQIAYTRTKWQRECKRS